VPLTTNALERLILTRLNLAPALLLDYFSTLGFRAALVGVRLGVFDTLMLCTTVSRDGGGIWGGGPTMGVATASIGGGTCVPGSKGGAPSSMSRVT
jgi:hypothetical protein